MPKNDLQELAKKVMQSRQFVSLLKQETKRLQSILYKYIVLYYKSYTPKINPSTGKPWYKRTYRFLNSLRINDPKPDNNGLTSKVYFDSSLVTRNDDRDYLPKLLNEGWNNGGKRYHYDFYEGFNFMDKAQEEFNRDNKYGIKVILNEK